MSFQPVKMGTSMPTSRRSHGVLLAQTHVSGGLKGLRFHDLRHHAITELAEAGATDYTIQSLAGHVSRRMLDHYCHVRIEPKKKAVELLEREPTTEEAAKTPQEAENLTSQNHVTNVPAEDLPALHVY
jgi:integrase